MKNFIDKKFETLKTLASNFTTEVMPVGPHVDNVGINIEILSVTDNTGSFFVDHRIFKDANNFSAWAELTLPATDFPALANADAVFLSNLNQLPKGQLRVRFVAAGGTPDGTCNIWFTGREL